MNSKKALSLATIPLLAAQGANAAIQYFDSSFTASSDSTSYWDIDADSSNVIRIEGDCSAMILYLTGNQGFVSSGGKVQGVSSGFVVSAEKNFAVGDVWIENSYNALFVNASQGTNFYTGFKFTHDSTTCYGWATFNYTFVSQAMELTIAEWAFEDSGATIEVGDKGAPVPEPAETAAGIGALALGAAGLRRWRKQRKAA